MKTTTCGVKQGLWKCWFPLQKEVKTRWGDSKNEVGLKHFKTRLKRGNSWWKRGHSWWKSAETWKTRLKRGGDILYCSHIINKSHRSYHIRKRPTALALSAWTATGAKQMCFMTWPSRTWASCLTLGPKVLLVLFLSFVMPLKCVSGKCCQLDCANAGDNNLYVGTCGKRTLVYRGLFSLEACFGRVFMGRTRSKFRYIAAI